LLAPGAKAGRAGEFTAVDPILATLLGPDPTRVRTVLREHFSSGRSSPGR
jgi:hypothetical protein